MSYWCVIPKRFGFTVSNNGNKNLKRTTVRWTLQVVCKYGSMKWLYIKYTKAYYPLEFAEYAVVNNINKNLAFNWWVKGELRARDQIISRMERHGVYADATGQDGSKKKYWRTTHKFGTEVPKTVEGTLEVDW